MVFRCFHQKLVPFDRHAVFGCTLNRYHSGWTGRINTVLIIYWNTTAVSRGNRKETRLQVFHPLFLSQEANHSNCSLLCKAWFIAWIQGLILACLVHGFSSLWPNTLMGILPFWQHFWSFHFTFKSTLSVEKLYGLLTLRNPKLATHPTCFVGTPNTTG